MSFTLGQRVAFTTPGRYPRAKEGEIIAADSKFLTVKTDDGSVLKTRPGMAKAA